MSKKADELEDNVSINDYGEHKSLFYSKRHFSMDETNFIPVDIYATNDFFVAEVEIPGVNVNDIKVSVLHNDLIIEGTKNEKIENCEDVNFLCMERSFGLFRRVISIEGIVDKSQIKAKYKNGILLIKLPKKIDKRAKVRIIPIEKEES